MGKVKMSHLRYSGDMITDCNRKRRATTNSQELRESTVIVINSNSNSQLFGASTWQWLGRVSLMCVSLYNENTRDMNLWDKTSILYSDFSLRSLLRYKNGLMTKVNKWVLKLTLHYEISEQTSMNYTEPKCLRYPFALNPMSLL